MYVCCCICDVTELKLRDCRASNLRRLADHFQRSSSHKLRENTKQAIFQKVKILSLDFASMEDRPVY